LIRLQPVLTGPPLATSSGRSITSRCSLRARMLNLVLSKQEDAAMTLTAAAPTRRHDIDALRVCVFGLLILFHVGMFYSPWGWHVKSEHIAGWLELPMSLSHQWRMQLVFLVSGLALNFLGRRTSSGQLARQRIFRLGVTLLFGMAVIIPPQAYLEALTRGATEPGYLHFLWRYFTFQPWPEGAFAGYEFGITWTHLWYLPYLLCYTLAAIPLMRFIDGPGASLRRRFQALRGTWLVLLPLVPLMASGLLVYPHFPYMNNSLVSDWYAHSQYFTFFFLGYLIGTDAGLWGELARLRRRSLALGLASFAALTFLARILPDELTDAQQFAMLLVTYLNRWIWIVTALGFAHRYLNRPFPWLNYANEAVYPWYVLHQTITIVAGYWLSRLALGPVVEPALVIVATIGGCALLHEFVIRPNRLLRPLFGMKPLAARRTPRPARIAHGGTPCPQPISAGSSD
jgi:glucan biosynthesis protein C